MTPVSVLTVDDQPVYLEVARDVIESTPGFVVAGEATSGIEAISAVERLEPDIVLMDVRMPRLDGIETARRLKVLREDTVVVLVTADGIRDVWALAEPAGAVALVLKERVTPRLLRELWAAHGPSSGD